MGTIAWRPRSELAAPAGALHDRAQEVRAALGATGPVELALRP